MSFSVIRMNRICGCRQKTLRRIIVAHIHLSPTACGLDMQKNLVSISNAALQEDRAKLLQNIKERGAPVNIDVLVSVAEEYNELENKIKDLLDQRRPLTKNIVEKNLPRGSEEYKTAAVIKEKLKVLEDRLAPIKDSYVSLISHLPNWRHPDVPVGDYSKNREVFVHGSKPEFSFEVRNHLDIGKQYDIVDFENGRKVAGRNFYYLKGVAAAMEMALLQYSMLKAVSKGYHPVITPDIVQLDMMHGSGYAPRTKASEVYKLQDQPYCLTGTAEIPLVGMFAGTSLALKNMPIRLVAFGRCFRPETGGYGNATRGLYRVHQFSKVELFAWTSVETGRESEEMLQEMVDIQMEISKELGLHYRVLEMATEELGNPAYHKYDLEAWMPGRNDYGETCSASNCTDFQSKRLSITYNGPYKEDGLPRTRMKYPHSVNATACAVPRMIVAILETFQQKDGSVIIPEVLHPYLPPEYRHLEPERRRRRPKTNNNDQANKTISM